MLMLIFRLESYFLLYYAEVPEDRFSLKGAEAEAAVAAKLHQQVRVPLQKVDYRHLTEVTGISMVILFCQNTKHLSKCFCFQNRLILY